jgi:hypothetical protein
MAEPGVARPTFYFHNRGEVNTQKALELARDRALELGIEKMVVASETGRSALRTLKVLEGTDIQLVVVTHPPATTTGPKGEITIGLSRPEYRHVKRYLEAQGAVVVQGTRPFGGVGRAVGWDSPVPATFVDRTLELFSSGTKIAIEVAIMATDAGAVEAGETVVTLGGTFKGLDTALVVKTAYSYNVFTELEVLEVIAKPRHPGKRLPEYEQEGWLCEVEQYYQPIELEG